MLVLVVHVVSPREDAAREDWESNLTERNRNNNKNKMAGHIR